MKIDIITLFPKMFQGPFTESIIKRAIDKKLAEINIHNLRKWAMDKRGSVDDKPYGGGKGMIIRVDIVSKAVSSLQIPIKKKEKRKIILLTPQGKVFNQKKAIELAKLDHLILICGHYEGFDERVRKLVNEEVSIGDYILTGGEIPAMVIVDSVVRLIPKVLKNSEAIKKESFSITKIGAKAYKLLEYPQYTRPEKFRNWKVPKILLSGNHKKIEEWRIKEAFKKTKKNRPDLII